MKVSCDSADAPLRPTRLDAAIAVASSFAMRAYLARNSWIMFDRFTPGVRMLALKNALGAVVAIASRAESSSARTYGSATLRPTYVGAILPYVSIGIM